MMSLGDPTQIDILRGRIEIAQMRGDTLQVEHLRRQIEELAVENAYDVEAEHPAPDSDDILQTSTLAIFRRDKRALVRLWITKLEDLAEWNVRRFRDAGMSQAEIERVYGVCAALEVSSIIGSGDVPLGIPEPNPYTIDLLDGRTVEDVSRLLDAMARGELTQRRASIEAGTPEEEQEYGYAHQRAGSLLDRHSCYYAGACLRALKEEHKTAMWLRGVAIEKLEGIKKRPWALRIVLRCDVSEVVKLLKASKLIKSEGWSWRGCRVIFVEQR